jgi:tetratricopeptide (TPR) repeat protein
MAMKMNGAWRRLWSAGQSREAVVLVCAILIAVLFTGTGFLTRAFHVKETDLAADWYSRGNASLAAGNAREALEDFRSALIFDPNSEPYQLHLAQALAQLGRAEEGRAYLLNLAAERPGDGEINFELARLAAQAHDTPAAVHFYHAAIYGAWDTDPIPSQIRARFELSQLLVRHRETALAEAELMSLAANVPEQDSEMHAKVGDLFQSNGDLQRALDEYDGALNWSPKDLTALIGAGMVSFKLGDYAAAEPELEKAAHLDPDNKAVAETLETSRLVVSADPFAPHLSSQERARRVANALEEAIQRADQCSAMAKGQDTSALQTPATQAKSQQKAGWSERNLSLHADQQNAAMDTVFKIEDAAKDVCGEATGSDAALLLIERKYRAIPASTSE